MGSKALFAPDPEMTEAEKTHSYKKETAKPRVVIVGSGFGGLYAARALAGAPVSVTLIDKRNYHLFRPLLYQVATGLLSADEISGPLRSILSRQKNIDVLLAEVTGVDTQRRVVRLSTTYHTISLSSPPAFSITTLDTTSGLGLRPAWCR